jgi:hypothetical protein
MPGIRLPGLLPLCLVATAPAALAAQACGGDHLSLAARAALQLPANFGIQGVSTGPGGALALWAADGQVLSVSSTRALSSLTLPDSIRPAGLGYDAAGLQLLDSWSGRVFRLSPAGRLTAAGRVPLAPGDLTDQAVWLDGGWAIAVRNSQTLRFRVRWYRDGRDTVLYQSDRADSLRAVPRFELGPAGGGRLFLTGLVAPFPVVRLDLAAGRQEAFPSPLDGDPSLIPPDSLRYWRALPAVAVDCAVLLTLTDLTSERRLLVRYSPSGEVERITPLEAPLGLMARLPGRDAVLAARRAGELELVWYDWRWVREPERSSP